MRTFAPLTLVATTATCAFALPTVPTNATTARALEVTAAQAQWVTAQICGMYIGGHDVGVAKADNPDDCSVQCYMLYRQDTNAASWTRENDGTCSCKKVPTSGDMNEFLRTDPGAVSFIEGRAMNGNAEKVVDAWGRIDLPGNDIGNVPAKTLSDCTSECLKWERCFAHTWTEYNGGTCWMKSKVTNIVYVNGHQSVSGYVARKFAKGACRP